MDKRSTNKKIIKLYIIYFIKTKKNYIFATDMIRLELSYNKYI